MTTVRIIVNDLLLGDVEVQQDNGITTLHPDRQRRMIQQLLSEAITKINAAYQLGETKEPSA